MLGHRTLTKSGHTMFHWRDRKAFLIVGTLLVCIGVVSLTNRPPSLSDEEPLVPDTLPEQLSDAEFWGMIEAFSEPNGYFRSDNLLSNESGLQDVIPRVKEHVKPGGVYIGVGPEQNFTYLLAFEPKISFIVDIRRLNMLEHLMYKALFELSEDRANFLSSLFSRPRPRGLTDKTKVEKLLDAYNDIENDSALLEHTSHRVLTHLRDTNGFPLSEEDEMKIRYVLSAFSQSGPKLTYSFLGSYYQGTLGMPTYRDLMVDTDGGGRNWSFLASEDRYRKLRDIQQRNLVVPLVGDFAGPRTLRAVGRYMRDRDALLSVFYTSNVEMYLFQQGEDWNRFYENVAALPFNSTSAFIRFAAGRGRRYGSTRSLFSSSQSQMWSPVRDVIASVRAREVDDYGGVLGISR